jgi:hypothetical protein
MPTNRKRLVVPTSMGAGGFEVLKTRDDGRGHSVPNDRLARLQRAAARMSLRTSH